MSNPIVKPVTPDGDAGYNQQGQFIIITRRKDDAPDCFSYSYYRDVRPFICPICKNGWLNTTESLIDQTVLDNDKVYHNTCVTGFTNLRNYYDFRRMFIGRLSFSIKEVPNEYGRPDESWYEITPIDYPDYKIVIGWRKRVMEIQIIGHLVDHHKYTEIFKDEDVTKGGRVKVDSPYYYIHAWDKEKAVEYIDKIIDCAGIRYKSKY